MAGLLLVFGLLFICINIMRIFVLYLRRKDIGSACNSLIISFMMIFAGMIAGKTDNENVGRFLAIIIAAVFMYSMYRGYRYRHKKTIARLPAEFADRVAVGYTEYIVPEERDGNGQRNEIIERNRIILKKTAIASAILISLIALIILFMYIEHNHILDVI